MGFFTIKTDKYGDKNDRKYNSLLNIPQYLPTGKQVDLSACYDDTKYKQLCEMIDKSNISDKEKVIFKIAATRFIDFNYENFAEYYCNTTSKETQEVMEKLALVLVDFNDAIKNGFVKQSQFINELVQTDPLNEKVMKIAAENEAKEKANA